MQRKQNCLGLGSLVIEGIACAGSMAQRCFVNCIKTLARQRAVGEDCVRLNWMQGIRVLLGSTGVKDFVEQGKDTAPALRTWREWQIGTRVKATRSAHRLSLSVLIYLRYTNCLASSTAVEPTLVGQSTTAQVFDCESTLAWVQRKWHQEGIRRYW